MAFSWTSAIRDRVSLIVFGRVYSSLRTDEQTLMDAAGSVPTSTPGGLANERLTVIRQWAQWFTQAGVAGSTAEEVWEHVWVREVAAHCALGLRRNDTPLLFEAAGQAWDAALDSFSVADASSATLNDQAVTVKMVRFHVIRKAMRLTDSSGRRRKRLIPVPDIDSAFNWAMSFLWNRTAYEFRTRQFTMEVTAATPQTPTITLPSGETFDAMASRWLNYVADTGEAVDPHTSRVLWADVSRMSELTAVDATATGRPSLFRVEDRTNGVRYWRWYPAPDQTYTLQGACLITTPAIPTDANDATPINKLPPEMRHIIPNLVWAKICKDFMLPGWQDQWRSTMDEVEIIAPALDDPGVAAIEGLQPGDVYLDHEDQRSYGGTGI